MTSDDAKKNAEALLATVKKLMTGAEIDACEWTKERGFEDEFEGDFAKRPEEPDRSDYSDEDLYDEDPEEWEEEMAAWEQATGGVGADEALIERRIGHLERLSIQFSREIADWINKRNAARARQTTKPS